MTSVAIDDRFDEHPKYVALGAGPMGLIACAITYANRNLSDGRIPHVWPERRFGREGRAIATALVAAGIWRLRPDGDFEIVGFLDHNRSRQEALALRGKRAQAGRLRWGKQARECPPIRGSPSEQDAEQSAQQVAHQHGQHGAQHLARATEGGWGGGLPLVPSEDQTRSQSSELPDRERDPGHTRVPRARENGKPNGSPPGAPGEPRRRLPRETRSGTFLKSSESREGDRDGDREARARPLNDGLPAPIADDEHRARAAAQQAALERWAAEGGETK